MKKQLDFPSWTTAQIEAMPESHISEWAAANKVFIDKAYASEDREGGIQALGTDMPSLTRETLSLSGNGGTCRA